jgi:hypothetical protein
MIISFEASSGQIRQSCPNREPEEMEIGIRKVLHILRLNKTTQNTRNPSKYYCNFMRTVRGADTKKSLKTVHI